MVMPKNLFVFCFFFAFHILLAPMAVANTLSETGSIFDTYDDDHQNIFESPENQNLALLDGLSSQTTPPTTTLATDNLSSELLLTSSSFSNPLSNADNLFIDDSTLNPDFGFADYSSSSNLLLPTDAAGLGLSMSPPSPECIFGSTMSSSSRKVRSRTNACDAENNADQVVVPPMPDFSAVSSSLYLQNRKKWCSHIEMNEFGNIPVCDMDPPRGSSGDDLGMLRNEISLALTAFFNIEAARISRLFFFGFSCLTLRRGEKTR